MLGMNCTDNFSEHPHTQSVLQNLYEMDENANASVKD